MNSTGGDLLAATLAKYGVEVAFGVHGGHLDAFLLACEKHGIRLVDTRHEAVAVDAANGYARATGGLGVAFATASSGFSNALAGLTTAYADRLPVLLITSSPPMREAETNPLQGGLDSVALAASATKWAGRATVVDEVPRLTGLAIAKAHGGAPGPSVLEVPIDIMFTPASGAPELPPGRLPAPPAADPNALDAAIDAFRNASRPALIVGGGAMHPRASAALATFAERTGIPVFHNLPTFGALPAEHPRNAWAASNLAAAVARGKAPDVVALVGARPGMFLAGRSGRIIPKNATLIHVDTDSSEIGRVIPADIGLTADAGLFLQGLVERTDAVAWPDWTDWAEYAVSLVKVPRPRDDDSPLADDGRLHPSSALREIMRALPPGCRIVVDGGETASWVADSVSEARPSAVTGFGGYLGFLGITFGLAIGTQVAWPRDRVVLVIGDGAFGFHLQEIDTMVRHGLPIVIVVVNNASWGQSLHGQEAMFGPGTRVVSGLADTAYHTVAEGLGGLGIRVSTPRQIGPAIARAFSSNLPTVINLEVSDSVTHPGTTAMVGYTDDPNVTVIPYYENITRPA